MFKARWRQTAGAIALAACALAACSPQDESGSPAEPQPPRRPWTLLYVMAYDNDLDRHTDTILSDLEAGVGNTEIAVAVLVDRRDNGGLRSIRITHEGRREETLPTDDSTSAEHLAAFLFEAARELPAEKYGVVFLDHGGGLDETFWDWRPAGGQPAAWMSAGEAAGALDLFRAITGDRVELLYLQQCGRGSLANVWTFRGAAPRILCSQGLLGAPNTYYRQTLSWLDANRDAGGAELAETIAFSDEHFARLTLVDTEAAESLPERVKIVTDALTASGNGAPALPALCYGGLDFCPETSFDAVEWFTAAAGADGSAVDATNAFADWMESTLIVGDYTGPLPVAGSTAWNGLALFVPDPVDVRTKNTDHPFLAATGLRELFDAYYPTR